MAEFRIWPGAISPVSVFDNGGGISVGTEFVLSAPGWVTKLWYLREDTTMGTGPDFPVGQIYQIDGGGLATPLLGAPVQFADPTTTGWQSVSITPLALSTVQHYKVVVFLPNGKYSAATGNNYWVPGGPGENGITNGILHAVNGSDATDGQSSFAPGSSISYPTGNFQAGNYWIDLSVSDVDPSVSPAKKAAFMTFFE